MVRLAPLLLVAVALAVVVEAQPPRCQNLWPQPRQLSPYVGNGTRTIDPAVFQIKLNSGVEPTDIIKATIERYKRLILQKVPVRDPRDRSSKFLPHPVTIFLINPMFFSLHVIFFIFFAKNFRHFFGGSFCILYLIVAPSFRNPRK
jgi:hypothetical protein